MSERRKIEVHVGLTPSELYWGSLLVQLGKFDAKRAILFLLSLAFLGGMIWALLSRSENETLAELAPFLGWILFPAVICGLTLALPYIAVRTEVRRNPKTLGPADYSFSEEGVELNASFGRSEVFWAAFEQIRETKALFLLYVSSHRAYAVPKRCFSSKAEIVEFRELLQRIYRGKLKLHPA